METYYIEFLNKEKNFARDRKIFKNKDTQKSFNDAIKWGKKNISNFHLDMIRIKFN